MRQLKQNDTENKKVEVCGMTKDQMIEEMRKINERHTKITLRVGRTH